MPIFTQQMRRAPFKAFARAMRLRPMPSGWISDHVYALDLGLVNAFLYRRDGALICFDTGFGRSALRRGLGRLGVDPERVSHVFLTHSDFDHAGGLNAFARAQVCLSEDEEILFARKSPPRFVKIYHNPKIRRAYRLLGDGETIRAGPVEIMAIKTPGHTPGSMSYLVDGAVLFTGDTLSLRGGLAVPNRYFCMDFPLLRASAAALSRLEGVQLLVTAHSGCAARFSEAMAEIGHEGA